MYSDSDDFSVAFHPLQIAGRLSSKAERKCFEKHMSRFVDDYVFKGILST